MAEKEPSPIRHFLAAFALTFALACVLALAGCAGGGLADGTYAADVQTDSSMVRVVDASVRAEDGDLTATVSLGGQGFSRLYLGTAEQAVEASEDATYKYSLNEQGKYTFTFPLEALDEPIEVALFGHRRDRWYDHTLVVSLADGVVAGNDPAVASGNGFGAAPAEGTAAAGQTAGGTGASGVTALVADFRNPDLGNGWQPQRSLPLSHATCFTVDWFEGGYVLTCLADGTRYLGVPQGADAPDGLADDIAVVRLPLQDVYLAASSTMCLFDALDSLDCISVSGRERDDWRIAAARDAMDAGEIVYGGKYNAPDYELLLSRGVGLAIESTMINHAPDVREKLVDLGIPVIADLSSLEPEPLGRAEWVKLYGALLGREEQAEAVFADQESQVARVEEAIAADGPATSPKTVAFFYINSAGQAVVRKPGDYVCAMIEQAGGAYAFADLDDEASMSSITLEMERFYTLAKDADLIIYNGTIDDTVRSLDGLVAKNDLLADFAAVQTGEVWVCEPDMLQQMVNTGGIIADFHAAIAGTGEPTSYVHRLG